MTSTIMWPARFSDLKREIAEATPDYEKRLTESWNDLLQELNKRTTEIAHEGPNVSRLRKFSPTVCWLFRSTSLKSILST
jgi:hypothetical protein